MRDFLRGTIGVLLQIVLLLLSFFLIFGGFFSCVAGTKGGTQVGWVMFILGIVCLAGTAGIRYWLGHIVRIR